MLHHWWYLTVLVRAPMLSKFTKIVYLVKIYDEIAEGKSWQEVITVLIIEVTCDQKYDWILSNYIRNGVDYFKFDLCSNYIFRSSTVVMRFFNWIWASIEFNRMFANHICCELTYGYIQLNQLHALFVSLKITIHLPYNVRCFHVFVPRFVLLTIVSRV